MWEVLFRCHVQLLAHGEIMCTQRFTRCHECPLRHVCKLGQQKLNTNIQRNIMPAPNTKHIQLNVFELRPQVDIVLSSEHDDGSFYINKSLIKYFRGEGDKDLLSIHCDSRDKAPPLLVHLQDEHKQIPGSYRCRIFASPVSKESSHQFSFTNKIPIYSHSGHAIAVVFL